MYVGCTVSKVNLTLWPKPVEICARNRASVYGEWVFNTESSLFWDQQITSVIDIYPP